MYLQNNNCFGGFSSGGQSGDAKIICKWAIAANQIFGIEWPNRLEQSHAEPGGRSRAVLLDRQ
jgi:hypothetical protein